jgi:hypothetical protein
VALRHDDVAVLTGLMALPLAVERKVDPPIAVPCHSSLANALTKGKAMNSSTLRHGERCGLMSPPCAPHVCGLYATV